MDKVSNRFVCRLWYTKQILGDEYELRIVHDLCHPDLTTVDIGANKGSYSLACLRWSKEAIAVEPNPQFADILRKLLPPKATVLECAVSDYTGTATLCINLTHGGFSQLSTGADARENSTLKKVQVEAKPLDQLITSKVGFIKIDVEGHELEVLRGSARTIETCRPNLLIEIEERHRPRSVSEVLRFFHERDYTGYFYSSRKLLPVSDFRIEEHQDVNNVGTGLRILSHKYINNFIFIPREKPVDLKPSLSKPLTALFEF